MISRDAVGCLGPAGWFCSARSGGAAVGGPGCARMSRTGQSDGWPLVLAVSWETVVQLRRWGRRGRGRTGPRSHTEFIIGRMWALNSDCLGVGSTLYRLSDLEQVALPLYLGFLGYNMGIGSDKGPAPTLGAES